MHKYEVIVKIYRESFQNSLGKGLRSFLKENYLGRLAKFIYEDI